MNDFDQLKADGYFVDSFIDKSLMQFCFQNTIQPTDQMKIEIFQEDCLFKDYRCDDDVFHLCMEFMTEHNLAMSDDVFEITDLYLRFRE
ncbi:hypothetical protein F2P81_013213 [Scophthalmus maximus]|uniref:Uncharacterized protein n=1 Tax=Scophthalmus maximus TaxID=52904 RepID=A0A6A4SS84_SCOMX|nr:hypothetical protein F2P81_013213 [Scophthalmus maximus]